MKFLYKEGKKIDNISIQFDATRWEQFWQRCRLGQHKIAYDIILYPIYDKGNIFLPLKRRFKIFNVTEENA